MSYEIGTVVSVHVNDLHFGINSRYGWENGEVIEAYKPHIAGLKGSIEEWGFKRAHPIEAFYSGSTDDPETKLIVRNGNNRTYAAKWIYEEDPGCMIALDEPAGHIWVMIVDAPASAIELIREQQADNKQLGITKLDTIHAYQTMIDEIIADGKAKGQAGAIKILAEQLEISKENLKKDLTVLKLEKPILDWLQESYLDYSQVKLSFHRATELVKEFGNDANTLLKEALARTQESLRDEYHIGGNLRQEWLDRLAIEIGLKEKPVKEQKPRTLIDESVEEALATLHTEQNEDDTETELDVTETNGKETATISTTPAKSNKVEGFALKECVKRLKGGFGMVLATAFVDVQEDCWVFVPPAITDKETATKAGEFIQYLNAALGDSDAVEQVEKENKLDEIEF